MPVPDNTPVPKRVLWVLGLVVLPICIIVLWFARELDGWVGFLVLSAAMITPGLSLVIARVHASRRAARTSS